MFPHRENTSVGGQKYTQSLAGCPGRGQVAAVPRTHWPPPYSRRPPSPPLPSPHLHLQGHQEHVPFLLLPQGGRRVLRHPAEDRLPAVGRDGGPRLHAGYPWQGPPIPSISRTTKCKCPPSCCPKEKDEFSGTKMKIVSFLQSV